MIIGVISALLLTVALLITPLKQDLGVVSASVIKTLVLVVCVSGISISHLYFEQALIISLALLALIIGFVVQKMKINEP